MLLTKSFLGPVHRPTHVLSSYSHLSLSRISVIPNNSENPTLKRNFHISTKNKNKYKGLKIDPTLQNQNTTKGDFVKYFRDMEKKMADALDRMPPDERKEREKGFWPKKDIDEYRLQLRDPSLIGLEIEDTDKAYENLNVNDEKHFSKALSYVSREETFPKEKEEEPRFPICQTLHIGRHAQVTAGGRVFSYSALVMLGTGRGSGGLGYARGKSVPEAIMEAKKTAEKNLISLDLWRGCHIGTDIKQRFKKSWMFMIAHPPGHGRRPTSWDMDIVLDAFGINDVSIGWGGSTNKHTRYRAIFKALKEKTRSPEKVARMLGMKLFNRAGAFYHTYD